MFLFDQNRKKFSRFHSVFLLGFYEWKQAGGNIKTTVVYFYNEILPGDIHFFFSSSKVNLDQIDLIEHILASNLLIILCVNFLNLNQVIERLDSLDSIYALRSTRNTVLVNLDDNVPFCIACWNVCGVCHYLLLNLLHFWIRVIHTTCLILRLTLKV